MTGSGNTGWRKDKIEEGDREGWGTHVFVVVVVRTQGTNVGGPFLAMYYSAAASPCTHTT